MKKFITSNIFFLIILTAVVFAVYGKSINFELTNLDDDTLTIRNIDYISDYRNIPDLFVNGCYFDKISPYYRPILNISFSLESIFFGYNLKVYHTTNILLFILSLFLIFVFVKRLIRQCIMYNVQCTINDKKTNDEILRQAQDDRIEWILKWLVVLFAVHPILSSVPVWLPARNDSLLTVFFISSLIFFIDYLNTKKTLNFFLYLFFYALALFTKETALPLVIIYPMIWMVRRSDGQKVSNDKQQRIEKSKDAGLPREQSSLAMTTKDGIPHQVRYDKLFNFSTIQLFNIIVFLAIFAVYFFLRHNETVESINMLSHIKNCFVYGKNIIFGIMIYIKQFIFPNYMPVMMYNISPKFITVIINLILFFSLIFIYYKKIIERKFILFSVIFFFLAIFLTFMQTEYALFFHRLIIILPTVLIILTLIINKILSKYRFMKKYFILIFILLLPIFVYASFNQTNKYKDSFTFWFEAYKDAPTYHLVCDGLAKEYTIKKDYQKALKLEESAIKLHSITNYCCNYAKILYNMGYKKESKEKFQEILKQNNKNYVPYEYLSKIFLEENDIDKAIEYAKKAIELSTNKDKSTLYNNLAWIYSVAGEYKKSIEILENLLKKDKDKTYYKNLSLLYEDIGEHEKAEEMRKFAEGDF